MQTLPRKQRAVIVLRYYEDLTEAEIADVLGISVGHREVPGQPCAGGDAARVHTQPMLARDGEEER